MRIIPALAGNTPCSAWLFFLRRDHPRSRGEYYTPGYHGMGVTGSSPLSRGIRFAKQRGGLIVGIIPALAGNTFQGVKTLTTNKDHPRSRGEYRIIRVTSCQDTGSSPLSRGIRYVLQGGVAPGGIIPALAGNTPLQCICTSERPDHPRSRGEYTWRNLPRRTFLRDHPRSRGEYTY